MTCTDWQLHLHMSPSITCIHLTRYSAKFRSCKVPRFIIEVHLKWVMWQKELGTFWNYPCSVMIKRYENNLQFNYHWQTRNEGQRGAFTRHLRIEIIWYWSCPVDSSDVDIFMSLFPCSMIQPVASCVLTDMDSIDAFVLSTCDACCTIQLLCHMLSPMDFWLQLPASLSLLHKGYMSDQASGCL